MAHPRIEEVEDSDVEMSDPSEGDIDDFDEADILRTRTGARPSTQTAPDPRAHLLNPSNIPSVSPNAPAGGSSYSIPTTTANAKAYANYHCIYPVYFDATRTRAEGRRVSAELAVPSPLAREIVNACRDLRLQTLFEPEKMHPKDWANPGRIKIAPLKKGTGGIKNKHQLYILIAQHLRNNPTTEKSASLWERIPGGPPPPEKGEKGYPRPAVPKGWKMGEFLPYYSPAMTGGGVSENLFKDMMKEMGGAGGAGMPGMPGGMDMASLMGAMGGMGGASGAGEIEEGGGKKKKEKKGKGKA
ncbi:signal recognition particle subunit [Gnomoniopsis sp. IMI 355080]|nr:signal recognition particle subunit [Gnomoniopsis sp. IMI 355080]